MTFAPFTPSLAAFVHSSVSSDDSDRLLRKLRGAKSPNLLLAKTSACA
jgi:hypothetical protein